KLDGADNPRFCRWPPRGPCRRGGDKDLLRRLGAPQRPALAHSLGVEYDLQVIKTGKRLKDRRSKTPRNPGGSVGMAKALWSTVPLPSSNEDRVLAVGVDAIFKALM